jgi:hypothetical protein
MLNKIQKIHLAKVPEPIYKTSAELEIAMQIFRGKQICMFIGQSHDQSFLMFTEVYKDGGLALDKAVAFDAPCPPFCGKEDNLYAVV